MSEIRLRKGHLLRALRFGAVVLASTALLAAGPEYARAATITVTTPADELVADGDCSLREAIQAANTDSAVDACPAGSGGDTITLPAGRYVVGIAGVGEDANATGDFDVTTDLTISGAAAGATIVDGAGLDRVIHVGGGAFVVLTDLTVANGVSTLLGGGILNGGSLTVERSHVTGNAAPGDTDGRGGGGIFNDGGAKLVLESSTVSGNSASGAAESSGGGIYNSPGGAVTLSNSTVSGNRAGSNGGGIFNADGAVTLDSSTLSGNAAGAGAGGIGGSRTITVENTLIANNTPSDCGPALASAGHNLLRDPTGCTLEGETTGNVVGVEPLLGPLAANGGPTPTHALGSGSPAVDAGSGDCPPPAADQRGVGRPQGKTCDIGAFELVPTTPPATPPGEPYTPPAEPPLEPPAQPTTSPAPVRPQKASGRVSAPHTSKPPATPTQPVTPPDTSAPSPSRPPPASGGVVGESEPPPRQGPGPALFTQVDQILKALPVANIAFNVPATLGLGESTVIQLRLSAQKPISQLKSEITALGKKEGARIKVSDRMEAHLTGVGFDIKPITPETQAISGLSDTEWRWEIKATETGTHRLHLTLSAVIDVKGSPSTRTIRTFERVLEVRVTWYDQVSGFLAGNWEWLWTTVLVPIGAWILKNRRRLPVSLFPR